MTSVILPNFNEGVALICYTLPQYKQCLAETLLKPLHVRCSHRANNALLFSRWFDDIRQGNYVVVSVIKDNAPRIHPWIITAYHRYKIA